jgi:hypothetical protein
LVQRLDLRLLGEQFLAFFLVSRRVTNVKEELE